MKHLNWSKRLVAGLLAVVLILSVLPTALAEETEQTQAQCTCAPVEGVHDAACPLYEAPGAEDGTAMPSEEADSAEETENSAAESENADPAADPAENNDATEAGDTDSTEQTESTETIASETPALFAATPRAGTPTMTATLSDAKSTFTLTDMSASLADSTLKGWGYTDAEKKTLGISLSGLTEGQTYQIKIELDKILYYHPLPETPSGNAYTVTYTQNEKLPMAKILADTKTFIKKGDTSYLHPNSGTLIFEFTATSLGTFQISTTLRYDVALWNRLANQSLRWDTTNPILKVSLLSGGEELSVKKIEDATSMNAHAENDNVKDGTRGVKTMREDLSGSYGTPFFVDDVAIMQIRSFQVPSGSDIYYYYETFTIEVDLPTCTDVLGNSYTMEFVKVTPSSGTRGQQNLNFIADTSVPGKVIITVSGVFLNTHTLCDIYLKFPDEMKGLDLARDDYYEFDYLVTCQANDDTAYVPLEKGKGTIFLDGNYGGQLKFFNPKYGYADIDWIEGGVASLGAVGLENGGNLDLADIVMHWDFDDTNTNAMGVTTLNLLADTKQQTITVKYRMVDRSGNLYPAADQEPFTYTFTNPYYNKTTSGFNRYITFHRGLLENEELHGYYFKMIEYPLSFLASAEAIGANYAPRSSWAPGAFWGDALTSAVTTATSTLRILQASDTKPSQLDCSNLSCKIVTYLNQSTSVILSTAAEFKEEEILAGNSIKLTVTGNMTKEIYTQGYPYLDKIRIGILLPKGALVQASSVEGYLTDPNPDVVLPCIGVEGPVEYGEYNFYILKFAEGYPIGTATESMDSLPFGRSFKVSFQIGTELAMQDTTLVASEILYISGEGFTDESDNRIDDYDVNGINGSSDRVSMAVSSSQVIIRSNSVSLDVTDSLFINGVEQTGSTVALNSQTDTISYQLNIKNENGGNAEQFVCHIAIPQNNLQNSTGTDKIVMSGAGQMVNKTGSTEMKLQYTTKAVTYETVDSLAESDWSDSVADWSQVTMVRLVTANGAPMINGSETTVTIPMVYQGEKYRYNAGASTLINADGVYDYVRGFTAIPSVISPATRTLELHYTEPAASGECTLTAAVDRLVTAPNVNTWSYNTQLSFYNPQEFRVEKLQFFNMKLVDVDDNTLKGMGSLDSNEKYKILVTFGSQQKALLAGVELGELAKDIQAQFQFDLYNGNALADATTERYVTFDLASDYVTIPVKIKINQEVAMISATTASIVEGKRYIPIQEVYSSVQISRDSAFTAQFVVEGMNNSNYSKHILTFEKALPAGASVVLLDYSLNAYDYARYIAKGGETSIALTDFLLMGNNTKYSLNESNGTFTEQLMFVVDFSGADCQATTNTISLTVEGENSFADIVLTPLKFETKAKRSFTLTASATTASIGNSAGITYSVTDAAAADSAYDGRKLALVIEGKEALPQDAVLTAGGKEYTLNSSGQFIVPLTDAQTAGTYSLNLSLSSVVQQPCALNVSLYVSATAVATKPLMGALVSGPIQITYVPVMTPALKVIEMSDRALTSEDLKSAIVLTYQTMNVPTGGSVTLEVQKKAGAAYATESILLEKVNGSSVHNGGVFQISAASSAANLSLQFNPKLDIENYQLLFKILDSNGVTLPEVPYRFIVTE